LATIADGEEAEVEIETRLPNRIAGTGYTIEIDDEIELRSTDPEIVVSVQFNLSDDMDIETDQTVRGGDILIEWDNDVDTLVVKNA
jgi:hypothetical protein